MNKKQKIWSISGIAITVIAITLYFILSEETICKGIDIELINNKQNSLINKKDIENTVFSEYKNLTQMPIDDINLQKLETKIETIPSIKNAEVFKKINGILGIKIEQRTPVLRVFTQNKTDFYIDEEGILMPLSDKGTVKTTIANGYINFKYNRNKISIKDSAVTNTLKDLYLIAKYIDNDKFLKNQIQQIYVTPKNEYELIPLAGNHKIMLGDILDYKKKLEHLKFFYKKTLNEEGWKKYSYINLKYNKQIICTIKKTI